MHQTNLGLTWKRKAKKKINFNSQHKIICVRIPRWKLRIEKCSHLSESLPTRRLLINEKLQQVWSSFCFLARKYGRIFFTCNFQFSILFFEMLRKLPQCYTHYSSSKNIFSLNDLTKNKLLGKKWDKLFFEHLKKLFSYSTFYSDSILVNIRIDFASK